MRATHIPRRPKKKPLRGKKVGFAEKKLRLWGIEAIDTIDTIDTIEAIDAIDTIDTIEAIEGVEEIVWGIFLNRDCLVKFFWWVWGGGG